MNPVWKTGSNIYATSDSGPSKTRVETSMNVIESAQPYSLGNDTYPPRPAKSILRRKGLTAWQQIAILLAMLLLIYLSW